METYSRNNRSFTNIHNNLGYTASKREVSPRPYIGNNYASNMAYNSALNKTTTSVHSEHLWNTLQQLELFPAELSELLRSQDRNIAVFKNRIDKQKSKVTMDFDNFKKEIIHYIEDLRLSVLAELDIIYKIYMEKYAKLKGEVLEIKRMRDEIEFEITSKGQGLSGNNFRSSHLASSNINTVKSIENGLKDMKKYHILNYISQLQKSKIGPVTDDAKDLIILTEYENGYYLHKELIRMLKENMDGFKFNLGKIYDNKYDYMREVENVIGKERDTRGLLDQLKPEKDAREFRDREQELQQQRQLRERQKNKERQLLQRQRERERERHRERERQLEYERARQAQRQAEKQRQIDARRQPPPREVNFELPVSPSKQTTVYEWLQYPKISQQLTVRPQGSDIALCALVLPNDQIAVGGKDGLLDIYSISTGQKICTLKGHKASICTLALVKAEGIEYLASGSDHGCSSILMWELSSMALRHRLEGHKAAVTAIVDLLDGQSMVSGSYDKKINVYNLKTGKISYNLPTNKSSVTGIVLNNTANKMVSCGLDNSLNVWQIIRSQQTNNSVQTLFLERIIQNNAMICSMVGSMMHQDIIYIGTKDGKVKAIDIEKGQSYKNVSCCNNAIIEMVILERESHPSNFLVILDSPIAIAWPCKQECFKVVNTENGKVTNVPARGHIQFGCGIGPKGLLLSRNGVGYIGMLSQSESRKQINFYRIENTNL